MQSKAKTVKEYLEALPPERKAAIQAVRQVILKNLPKGCEEIMQYGMIGYVVPHSVYPPGYHCDPKQPLPFVALASQKNHMAIYFMNIYMDKEAEAWFTKAYKASGKKLDMGKSCLRFKKVEDLKAKDWKEWLEKNLAKSAGIWLRFFKKDSGVASVTYDEALDEALCYGWIDGLLQKYDDKSWLRKFTPRRSKSLWSKRNIEHARRLSKSGKMQAAGKKEMEAARTDGRWKNAYDSSGTMNLPKDFLAELSKNKKARAFFETLNRANTYAIAWRLQTAKKPETKARRMRALLDMLARGKKLH